MRPGGPGRGKGFAEISGFFLHGGADHSVGAFTTTRFSGIRNKSGVRSCFLHDPGIDVSA